MNVESAWFTARQAAEPTYDYRVLITGRDVNEVINWPRLVATIKSQDIREAAQWLLSGAPVTGIMRPSEH